MADDWHVQSLFHFTVNVTDFERSIDFYTKVGFSVLRDNRDVDWPDSVAAGFGMTRAKGRGALLGIGDGPEHTRLDLLQWLDPPYDPAPPGVPIEERVPRIVALRTSDVRAAYRDLKAQGIEFVSEVHSLPGHRCRGRGQLPRPRRPAGRVHPVRPRRPRQQGRNVRRGS